MSDVIAYTSHNTHTGFSFTIVVIVNVARSILVIIERQVVDTNTCTHIRFNPGVQIDIINSGYAEAVEFVFPIFSAAGTIIFVTALTLIVGVVCSHTEITKS